MAQNTLVSPFIVKPDRINNYTHLIALLKLKQAKYKRYAVHTPPSPFANVLGSEKDTFNIDNILEGFLHQKLLVRFEEYTKQSEKKVSDEIADKIKSVLKENDQIAYKVCVGNAKEVGDSLFSNPGWDSFKDWLLMDLWHCVCQRMKPLEFLHYAYFKHMQLFMGASSPSEQSGSDTAVRQLVPEFVRKRFNCEEYALESYESRYLWAELFVLFRLGRVSLVRDLLSQYEIFFEFMAQKFRSCFLEYLDGRSSTLTFSLSKNDDKFKRFFFDLLAGHGGFDQAVISTAEDYIWARLLSAKGPSRGARTEISSLAEQFSSPKIRFMALILAEEYDRAIDTLLKSDFALSAKFLFMREICLEQQLDVRSSGKQPNDLYTVNPLFFNFIFNIASQMVSEEHKVRLVEMLRPYPGYYEIVPRYIIKYGLQDILSGSDPSGAVGYSLDAEITEKVVAELRSCGDKAALIRLCHILPEDSMGEVLMDALEEAILTDEPIDTAVVEKYISKLKTKKGSMVRELYGIYLFCASSSIGALRSSVLSTAGFDLARYRFVVEKVFPKAVDVVKIEKDREMAKHLFKICGVLDLSEDCCAKASSDLVDLI